jgi:hypothetical protein
MSLKAGRYNYFRFYGKPSPESVLMFWLSDEAFDTAKPLLDATFSHERKAGGWVELWTRTDKSLITSKTEVFRSLARLVRESLETN